MADNNNDTKVVLDLDNSSFMEQLQSTMGMLNNFGEGLGALSETLVGIGEVAGVALIAFGAVKGALDLTEEAEKIQQVNRAFDTLSASAGVSSKTLKDGLVSASKGLIDETTLLEAANKAIVIMGDSAGKLPQVMELARKATSVFGGDLTQNFTQLSQALASGNTRMLRHFGIVVDATKAQDEYAASLGVSRNYLDSSGQRLAVMNAALEQGKEKYAGINDESMKTSNNMKRMSVDFTELKDAAILAWDRVAGPWVSAAVEKVASAVHSITGALKNWLSGSESNNKAQSDSNKLQEQKIALIKQEAAAQDDAQKKKTGVDSEKVLQERQKLNQELAKLNKSLADDQVKNETDVSRVEADQAAKKLAIEKDADEQIKKLRKEAGDAGLANSKQIEQATEAIHKKAVLDMQAVDRQTDQARLAALKNLEEQNKNTTAGITAAWDKMGEQSRQNFKDMSKAGEMAFNQVGSQAVAAFKAIGDGSKSASQAMAGFFFGALGGMAEKQGEVMLLAGLWPFNPAVVAAGGALVALGAAISSLGSGGSSSSSSSSSGSAGTASIAGTTAAATQPTPQQTEKKTVNVQIMGHYFETDQTRQALMNMVRQAGDFTDFNLKAIGQP